MKIKITNKKSGLEVGKVYDLCDMAAKNLIGNRVAVIVEAEKPVEPVKEKTGKGKNNGLQNK